MKKIFMYAGQGTHYYGMGRLLFEQHNEFKRWINRGETIIQDLLHRSLIESLYGQNHTVSTPFTDIHLSHPAIVIIGHALAQTLKHEGIEPDAVWGNSIGELTAAITAHCISFDDAVCHAVEQAEQFERHCPPGGMLAILDPHSIIKDFQSLQALTLAAINYDKHFVVAGEIDNIEHTERTLQQNDVIYQRLPVAYGFHSPAIDPAQQFILSALTKLSILPPQIPFFSSAATQKLNALFYQHIWQAIRQPIYFQKTLQSFDRHEWKFIDISAYGTLSTFIKYNNQPEKTYHTQTTLTPMQTDNTWLNKLQSDYQSAAINVY